MKKILILVLFVCSFNFSYSSNDSMSIIEYVDKMMPISVLNCASEATAQIRSAYDMETHAWVVCWRIHTTAQGYTDCRSYATRIRRLQVRQIYMAYTECVDINIYQS